MFSTTPSLSSSTSSFGSGHGFGQYSNTNVSSTSGFAGFGLSTNTNISATGAFGSQFGFGQSSNTNVLSTNPFGYQNGFGKTSNPDTSGSSSGGGATFTGGTSTSLFGTTASPFSSTTPTVLSPTIYGSSSASLSSSNTNVFQQSSNTNVSSTNPFGSQNVFWQTGNPGTSESASTGGATFGFGAPNFGPAPGSLFSTPMLATSSSPYIWSSSSGPTTLFQAPAINASSSAGFSFGCTTTPGQSTVPFGTNIAPGTTSYPFAHQNPFSFSGSRVTSYNETAEMGDIAHGRLLSISAMPVYKDKCHEELRWEDNQLGDKGCGIDPASVQLTASKCPIDRTNNPFLKTVPSSVPSNPFSPRLPSSSFPTSSVPPNPFLNTVSLSAPSPFCWKHFSFLSNPSNVPPITSSSGLNTAQSSSFFTPPTPPAPPIPSNSNSLFGPNQFSCFISPPCPPAAPFSSNFNSSAGATSIFQPIPFNYASFAPFPHIYSTSVTAPATASIPCQFVPVLYMIPPSTSSYMPSVTQKTEDVKPSSITSPYETPSVAPTQMLSEGPRTTTTQSQRYGISSTPVSERPSPVKSSSLLTIRHVPYHRQKRLLTQVAFSADAHKTPSTARIELPRDNPRAFIDGPSGEWNLRVNFNNISLDKHTSIHLDENGDVSVEVSTPVLDGSLCQDKDGDSGETSAAAHSLEHNFANGDHPTKKEDNIAKLMPKLKHSDYFMEPRVEDLAIKESSEPGFCSRVKDFVVGRHGYGSIKFLGETDVRQLDLESYIEFRDREVIVYMDESKKPPVGEGLNKPAEITLSNIKCVDKTSGKQYIDGPKFDKYREMLMKKAAELGAEFMSYDPVLGEWKFRVAHF